MALSKFRPIKQIASGRQRKAEAGADYAAIAGVAFEGLETYVAEKIGGVLNLTGPDGSTKPTFHITGANDGELDTVEFYDTATQTTGNRRAKVTMGYDGSLNPTSETWVIYDPADGTTVLRTVTITHTFTGVDLTKSVEVTT